MPDTPPQPLVAVPVARPHVAPRLVVPSEPVVSDTAAEAPKEAPVSAPPEEQSGTDPAPALPTPPSASQGDTAVATAAAGDDGPPQETGPPEPSSTPTNAQDTGDTSAAPPVSAPQDPGPWERIDYGRAIKPGRRPSPAALYVGERYSGWSAAARKWFGDRPWRCDFDRNAAGQLSIVKGPDCSIELNGDKAALPFHVIRAVFAPEHDLTSKHTWRLEPCGDARRRILVRD